MKKRLDNQEEKEVNICSNKLTSQDFVTIWIEIVIGLCASCVILINCMSIYGLMDVGDMWHNYGSIVICLMVMLVCEGILCIAFYERIMDKIGPIVLSLVFSCLLWNGSYILIIAAAVILIVLCIFRIVRHDWVKWTGKLVLTTGVILEVYSLLWLMSGEEAVTMSQRLIGSMWVDVILIFGVVILFLPQKAMDVLEGRSKLHNLKKSRKKKTDDIDVLELEEIEALETESEDESPKSDKEKIDKTDSFNQIMGAYPEFRYSLYLVCSMVFAFLTYSVSVFKVQSILWTEWDKWEQVITESGIQTAEIYIRLIIFGGALLAAVQVFFISESIRHVHHEKGNLYNALTAVIIVCLPIYVKCSFTTDGIWKILFMTVFWAVIYLCVMALIVKKINKKLGNVFLYIFVIAVVAFAVGSYFTIKNDLFDIPMFWFGLLVAVVVILIRDVIGLLEKNGSAANNYKEKDKEKSEADVTEITDETEAGKTKVSYDSVLNVFLAANFIAVALLCCGSFGKMSEDPEKSISSYEELLAQLEEIADINGEGIAYVNTDDGLKRYCEYFYEGRNSIDFFESVCDELFLYNVSVIPTGKVTSAYLLLAQQGDSDNIPDVWIENMSSSKADGSGWLPELYTVATDISGCSIIVDSTAVVRFKVAGYEISELDPNLIAAATADITDGIMNMWEWYGNEHVAYSGLDRVISKGGVAYGPYRHIDAGEYVLVLTGDNLDEAMIDVGSNTAGSMDVQVLSQDAESVTILTTIPEAVDDIEFRVWNYSSQEVIYLRKMSIEKKY